MKNIIKKIGLLAAIFVTLAISSCKDDIDPVVDELSFSRLFQPLELEAKVRNQTVLELNWQETSNSDYYVVQINKDSLSFNDATIVLVDTITADEMPYSYDLPYGDTRFSARVKSINSTKSIGDSNWATVTFRSEAENLFINHISELIAQGSVTIRWESGKEVTSLLFIDGSNEQEFVISAEERSIGEKTITSLDNADYEIRLLNGTTVRGFQSFVVEGDVFLSATDDLSVAVGNATDGDVIVLSPGEYLAYAGTITIDKSLTIRGLSALSKPVVHVGFELGTGIDIFNLKYLNIDGQSSILNLFTCAVAGTYTGIYVDDCEVHDFTKSIISGGSIEISITMFSINNSVFTNILTGGGDGIDFRGGYANISLTNNTFNNCAPSRDFIRMDDAGLSQTGMTADISIDHCTFYKVSNSASRRLLYVRFLNNELAVKYCIITETLGYYTNQANSSQPKCSENNYFNANGFITPEYVANAKIDDSNDYTTLDPGFNDAENGDFTISEQILINNEIGDPRWR